MFAFFLLPARLLFLRFRALEDIIDPFYGDDVPRQHGGTWRQSFRDLEQSRSGVPLFSGRMTNSCFFCRLICSVFCNLFEYVHINLNNMLGGRFVDDGWRGGGGYKTENGNTRAAFSNDFTGASDCVALGFVSSDGGKETGGDGRQRRSFFGELTEQHFKHSQLLTPDELDDRMRSISVIATRCDA